MFDKKYQTPAFVFFLILIIGINVTGYQVIDMIGGDWERLTLYKMLWFFSSITLLPFLFGWLFIEVLFKDKSVRDFTLRSVDLHSGEGFGKHTERFLFNDITFQIPGACKKFYIDLENTGEVKNTGYGCATDCNPVLLANLDNYVQFSEQDLILCQIDEYGYVKFKYMGRDHNKVEVTWELGQVYTPQSNDVRKYPVKGPSND